MLCALQVPPPLPMTASMGGPLTSPQGMTSRGVSGQLPEARHPHAHPASKLLLGRCAAAAPNRGGPAPVLLKLDAVQCSTSILCHSCLQGVSSSPRPLLQQASSFRRQSSMQRTSSAAESQSSTAEQSLAARGLPAVYDPNGEDPSAGCQLTGSWLSPRDMLL